MKRLWLAYNDECEHLYGSLADAKACVASHFLEEGKPPKVVWDARSWLDIGHGAIALDDWIIEPIVAHCCWPQVVVH